MTSEPAQPGAAPRAVTATDPAPCAVSEPAAPALPGRIRGVLVAVRPGRQAQPQADPEILRQVLDGLSRL